MAMTRREWMRAMAATGALPMAGAAGAQAGTLKISHQFPGGTATEGDFRDRLCRRFAADIEKKSNGALKAAVYPGSSLMKTNAQFSRDAKGRTGLSAFIRFPMPEAKCRRLNIGLMPALVTSLRGQGAAWKTMRRSARSSPRLLEEKGIVMVSWIWQAGGVASRTAAVGRCPRTPRA